MSASANLPAALRRSPPSGWWGALLLVATETMLFAGLIATYLYLEFSSKRWPPLGVEKPSVALPLMLTGVLVLTAVPMFRAASAGLRERPGEAAGMLALAFALQAGYLAVQIILFRSDLHKFSPKGSAYGSIYFTLLIVHHAHVAVGLLLDLGLLYRLRLGLSRYRVNALRVVALYWGFVALAGIAVVLTQVSPSL